MEEKREDGQIGQQDIQDITWSAENHECEERGPQPYGKSYSCNRKNHDSGKKKEDAQMQENEWEIKWKLKEIDGRIYHQFKEKSLEGEQ